MSNRAAALFCAIAQEAMRVYADERRSKPSLWAIQRDAENNYKWLESGTWGYVAQPYLESRE